MRKGEKERRREGEKERRSGPVGLIKRHEAAAEPLKAIEWLVRKSGAFPQIERQSRNITNERI